MDETTGFLESGAARLAWRRVAGREPLILWLGGFRSNMAGTKAVSLAEWAGGKGRAFLRFDYFGHGASDGRFETGTITRWRGDTLAVIDRLTRGPLVLVGSSMGAWLACLASLARPDRIKALVLIAPAADFTEKLLSPGLPREARAAIERDGAWLHPPAHGEEGYLISRALLEDGARWSILPGPAGVEAPVRILHGGADPDVPWSHGLDLAKALTTKDLVFTLVRDGDHRLSRPQDLERLIANIEEVSATAWPPEP
ncbi:MAG TPA: alpha/beta hydrolase [Caulobacteraceae bacterium]